MSVPTLAQPSVGILTVVVYSPNSLLTVLTQSGEFDVTSVVTPTKALPSKSLSQLPKPRYSEGFVYSLFGFIPK